MNERLAAALRIVAPAGHQPASRDHDRGAPLLPGGLAYADSVRRFDPSADPLVALTHATAVAHLVRLHRTVETLHGFASRRGVRVAIDADHLYLAHGDPRD